MRTKPLIRLMCLASLFLVALAGAIGSILVVGCSSAPKPQLKHQVGESVVFVGEEPAALAWLPAAGKPLKVRSTYMPATNTVDYVEGRDFTVDRLEGMLRRTAGSRIPDFRTNILFGQQNFDHSQFPGFGNGRFLSYVDYSFTASNAWPVQAPQTAFLKRTQARLNRGDTLKIVAFGDSITAGLDLSKPSYVFWERWANELREKYPRARVSAQNGATSGDSTLEGLSRLKSKVLDAHPDLVLIGFGMNDHNRQGVPVPQFEQNLKQIITRIRGETPAEVILYSAFPPNPQWKHGSHHMADYAAATERVAREEGCAYADIFTNWQALAARKKPEDLLANDINHPSDFGQWIYYRVFSALGL